MNPECLSTDEYSKKNKLNKYANYFKPAKYLVPAAIFIALLGAGCDDVPGDEGDDDPTIDPSTIIDAPSFNDPIAITLAGLSSISNYYIFHPALADMDDDGDLDLIAGYQSKRTGEGSYYVQSYKYFENTPVSRAADFQFSLDETIFPSGTPYRDSWDELSYIHGPMFVSVGDIDSDSDTDIVSANNEMSSGSGSYYYSQNVFFQETGASGFESYTSSFQSSHNHAVPVLVDIDGDGDLDLTLGQSHLSSYWTSSASGSSSVVIAYKKITYLENDGSGAFSEAPEFVIIDEEDISNIRELPVPVFVDIDGDGDQDMFVIMYDTGNVTFYLNTGTATVPVFDSQIGSFSMLPSDGVRYFPTFGDIDGDTDMDIIAGTDDGRIMFIENTDIDIE